MKRYQVALVVKVIQAGVDAADAANRASTNLGLFNQYAFREGGKFHTAADEDELRSEITSAQVIMTKDFP